MNKQYILARVSVLLLYNRVAVKILVEPFLIEMNALPLIKVRLPACWVNGNKKGVPGIIFWNIVNYAIKMYILELFKAELQVLQTSFGNASAY